jgi:hypothetical protein
VPAALLHNAIDGRKPESGTVAESLGREERLEDARLRSGVHAAAGVGHGEGDVGAGCAFRWERGYSLSSIAFAVSISSLPPAGMASLAFTTRLSRTCSRWIRAAYCERNRVARLINRLKQCRRVAKRYEKRAAHCLAMLTLAAVLLWL